MRSGSSWSPRVEFKTSDSLTCLKPRKMLATVLNNSIKGLWGYHRRAIIGMGTSNPQKTNRWSIRPSSKRHPNRTTTQIKAFSPLKKELWLKKCFQTGDNSRMTQHQSTTSLSSLWWLRWWTNSTLKLSINSKVMILANRARIWTTYAIRRQLTRLNNELDVSWDMETSPTWPIRTF